MNTSSAYIQDNWNRVDFSVLLMSLLDLAGAGQYLGSNFTSVIKISRALRPILLLRKNREMKKVVVAFIGSAKPIFYALLFLALGTIPQKLCAICLVTIMFSTMGMALFKGKFHACNDGTLDGSLGQGLWECTGNMMRDDGVYMARVWERPHSNFDSFPSSCLTLLKCLTLKWVTVFHLASDTTSEGVQPVMHHNNSTAALYFVMLIVTGSFISLNFFVSFVVDGFYAAQGQSEEEQTEEIYYEWIQQKMILHWPGEDVDPPDSRLSQMCRAVVQFRWFQNFSALCVLTNVVCISLSHEGESEEFSLVISYQNDIFFGIMCAEVLLNFIALGIHNFWKDNLNRFDVTLIIVTTVCTIAGSGLRTISQVIRSFRLARFSRALFRNKLIEAMFDTVLLSVKQVLPVILVLALGMSIFAVIGVAFFGTVKMGNRLGPTVHFESFGAAFLSLTQILFGDEWHQLMEDCSLQHPFCTTNFVTADGRVLSYGDCGQALSPVYFMSFKVLCEFTILNLFVGMILNNFSFCADGGNARTIITEHDIERFARIWVREADTKQTGTIPMDFIYKLMFRIGAPLGMYGTKQNIGRFLCVREHVRRQVEALDDDSKMGYGTRMFRWIVRIEMLKHEQAMIDWREMQKTAKRYGRELKERDMSEEKTGLEQFEADMDFSADDDEEEKDPNADVSFEDENADVAQAIALAEKKNFVGWYTAKPATKNITKTVSGGQLGHSGVLSRRIVVVGGKMGYGGAPKNKGPPKAKSRKVVKKQVTHDYNTAKILAKREEEKTKQMDAWIEEDRMKHAFITMAKGQTSPKPTWGMKIAGGIRWFIEGMISKRTAVVCKRLPGYACYDDVFNALLYWNNKDDIIPSFLLEERRVEDDIVISTVANQLIEGLMRGAIFRRRRRRMNENVRAQAAMGKAIGFLKKFRQGKGEKAEEARIAAARLPTPIPRPSTGCRFAAENILYDEGGDTDRGILATLILDLKIDSFKLADKAQSWGFKLGDDGVMGVDDRGIGLLMGLEDMAQPLKELKARRNIHSLSGEEARLLRMAADMNGIDLQDVPDIADLPYEDLATILGDSTVKSKLDAMEQAAAARRAAEELEAEKIRNGTKTPAEIAELRRVQKQKERLEKLNKQIEDERSELQRQLEESKKQREYLSKEYAHARREAAHFASEALKLANRREHSSTNASALPQQLAMTDGGAESPAGQGHGYTAGKMREDAITSMARIEARDEVPWNDADLEGTPAEVTKKLADKISIQKSLLERLERQLAKFKSGDPNAGKRQPSSWAYRGDVEAMKAVRQQKILEATKKRDERVHGNRLGPSASIVAALGLGGEPGKKAAATWRGGKDAARKPNWL